MQGSANAFSFDNNMLAALTGKFGALIAAITTSLPYNIAGTTVIDDDAGLFQQLTTGAGNTTLNTDDVGVPGQLLILEIANDAGGARTITLGANFRGTGNIVGTASKSIMIAFMSNGVKWMELFRTAAIT
jgi:hypothetical protein